MARHAHGADHRSPSGRGRRPGGRLHGVLVYAIGVMMVLSSVYGVAHSVGDRDNVVVDSASYFRSFFGGDPGQRQGSAKQRPAAPTVAPAHRQPTVAGAAPAGTRAGEDDGSSAVASSGTDPSAGVQPSTSAVATASAKPPASPRPPASPKPSGSAKPSAAATSSARSTTGPVPSSSAAPAPLGGSAPSTIPTGTWLSGAAGDGVAGGTFGTWRGTPVTIGGTWADNNEAMTELWQLDRGGEFGSWNQALDIAIGAFDDGESWQQAAQGAYDARWRASLTNLKAKWGNRTSPLFIRFAHEMNGNWYPWSVGSGDKDAFVAAWKHFRKLQKEIFPTAKLVFSLNRESVGSGFDWRQSFPGAQHVDVIGVDYYNQYPTVTTAGDWTASLDDVDKYGAPKGLQQHLAFARSVGLPLSVPEWSGHATNADSPAWIEGMHSFFAQHAGGGAGQLLYEVQFNIDMHGDSYRLYPSTRMTRSAEAYRRLF